MAASRAPSPGALSARERWIALGLGLLFTGNVYLLFKSIEAVDVPVAILTYFIYPLLTGLAGAVTGLDRLDVARRGGGARGLLGAGPDDRRSSDCAFDIWHRCSAWGRVMPCRDAARDAFEPG